jgi:hypothetical protein
MMIGFNTGGDECFPIYKSENDDIFIPISLFTNGDTNWYENCDIPTFECNNYTRHTFDLTGQLIIIDPCYINNIGEISVQKEIYYDTNWNKKIKEPEEVSLYLEDDLIGFVLIHSGL